MMEDNILKPSEFKENLLFFKQFLDGVRQLCDEFESRLLTKIPERARPKKYKKREKDPQAPKMPKSAFIYYFQENKDKVWNENKTLSFQEVTKLIADEWKKLTQLQQEPYILQAETDRIRYNYQQQQYSVISQRPLSKYIQKKLKYNHKQEVDYLCNANLEEDSFGANLVPDENE